jgi:hypothetical protein
VATASIQGICQIALVATDIEKTARSLCEVCGLPMPEISTQPPAADNPTVT